MRTKTIRTLLAVAFLAFALMSTYLHPAVAGPFPLVLPLPEAS